MAGIDRTRTLLPPSFGILLLPHRHGLIRVADQFVLNLHQKILHAAFFDGIECDSIDPRCAIVTLGQLVGFAKRFRFADVDVRSQKRQVGSAFALTYILLLRSCKLMGAFLISPLPPVCWSSCTTAGPLRSTGITPLPRYYWPLRHLLAVC